MNAKDLIYNWFVDNRPWIRDIIEQNEDTKRFLFNNEPTEFHNEIEKQFNETIQEILTIEIGRNLGLSVDKVKEVLEDLNIEDFA